MNKSLLLSLATITILTSSLNAETMFERIQTMEIQIQKLQKELDNLRKEKASNATKETQTEKLSQNKEEEEDDEDEESIDEKIADIQENLTELNKHTNGNHLKFGVDYRFTIENMQYTMADSSTQKNDAFITNRLWMNMNWAATKHLSFTGQLAYNKAFGQRSGASDPATAGLESFDWISNENAYDDKLRVRSAYFFYKNNTFLTTDIPWTFSVGRRPSANGHLINFRDDDHAASPMGHTVNVEFDGLSSKFGLENITGIDGMYVKFCAGRALSNAAPKLTTTPYSSVDDGTNPDIDLIGLIVVPYNDGQYSLNTQYYYANNLIDTINPNDYRDGFVTVGGLHSFTANFIANGIGDGIADFLDDTIFFVSGAMSVTDPNKDQGMLGSAKGESKTGYSYWVGTQFPSLLSEDGRWGLEYNHGSQYWRSITYAEDTNIGSKVAARGDAYEAYFTEPLIEDILSLQIRYTYIDYKYTGSNGFFGNTTGAAILITPDMPNGENYVDKAQDIRFYLRYKY
jgi:TolA-binding protein